MNPIIEEITKEQIEEARDHFKVGDGVKVYVRVREGGKERTQVFSGIVICRKGRGVEETFTVRRIVQNEGVERTFPLHGPRVRNVVVNRAPNKKPRRARLYYLRGRSGKSAVL